MGSGCSCIKKSKTARVANTKQSPRILIRRVSENEHDKSKHWEDILKDFAYFTDPLSRFCLQNPAKFRRLLIFGPPAELRWQAWKVCFKFSPKFPADKKINSECLQLIEKDLERTFPFHPFFTDKQNLESLKDLLISVVSLNPDLGYCQGMNYVAGIFLLVSNCNVSESTSMMDTFIHKLHGKGLFEPGFPKVIELTSLFAKSFKAKIPSLSRHFAAVELDDNLWLTKWFMTMFSYSFKTEVVIRLWDVIFATNLNFMVNLVVGILDAMKKSLKKKELPELIEFFPNLRGISLNFEAIIANTFRSSSILPGSVEDARKDTDPDDGINESQFRLNWDCIETIRGRHEIQLLEIDHRKRSNSLVIQQHSPKLT